METPYIAKQKDVENSTTGGNTKKRGLYSEAFRDQLKPPIQTKRRGLLSKLVAKLLVNPRPHSASHATGKLCYLNSGALKRLPYSDELLLCDYHHLVHSNTF
jgi:hypothetical protein